MGYPCKFPWFWKSPRRFIKNVSDVLININCGRIGAPQDKDSIDSVRKARKQILIKESKEIGKSEPNHMKSEHYDSPDKHIDMSETTDETRHKRVIRKPRWMRDYLSVF